MVPLSLSVINIIEHLTKDKHIRMERSVMLITFNHKGSIRMTLSLVRCSVILITFNYKGSKRMTLSLVRCSVILITFIYKGTRRMTLSLVRWNPCN
jgi:hypothetical protein